LFSKNKNQSLNPEQVNEALDAFSALHHPNGARLLRQRINRCVRWANKVADISNAKSCFRNLGVFSCDEPYDFPVFTSKAGKLSDNLTYDDWMWDLDNARLQELGEDLGRGDDLINLAGGQLLVAEPWGTTCTGISSEETNELFDLNDLPPIGLWVAYIGTPEIVPGNAEFHPPYFRDDGYILSYVPSSFVELVQRGIDVNIEDCIYWLEGQDHVSAKIIKSWEILD